MPSNQAVKLRTVKSQPSWRVANDRIEAFVTRAGGHLGPVTFDRKDRKLQPLSVAPWHDETLEPGSPQILKVLRGDFFCMPFGGNQTPYRGQNHPPHGDTANLNWSLHDITRTKPQTTLHATLECQTRPGYVDKRIRLVDGHPLIYQSHTVSGMSGKMSFGHHAMVKFPETPGSGLLSTSRFVWGQVFPEMFEWPEDGGYQSLKPGAQFDKLGRVPDRFGNTADLSTYPARRGFEDLVMIVHDPARELAWNAVSFPKQRYAWFSIKRTGHLPATVLWHSNAGRHYAPWSGRHHGVLGIEDVCSYFHHGLAESVKANPVNKLGHDTAKKFSANSSTRIPYAFGCVPTPRGFDRVSSIKPTRDSTLTLRSASGKTVVIPFDHDWLG